MSAIVFDLLDVVGIFGISGLVLQAGDLPQIARFIVLHRSDNAHAIALGEYLHARCAEICRAVVYGNAKVDARLFVVFFNVHGAAAVKHYVAFKGDFDVAVRLDVASQLFESELLPSP